MIIEGEQAYPIYFFSFKWSQEGIQDPKYPNFHKGLPEGRIWNCTSRYSIYKEEQNQESLNKEANDIWDRMLKEKKIINPSDLKIDIKFKGYETWCLTWFQHFTFNVGQSDEAALLSFERFVERKERLIRNDKDAYCLMGAEDRWRWKGQTDDGKETEAPCHCKFCKEQGVIRIGH